jgi:hypothetical protein
MEIMVWTGEHGVIEREGSGMSRISVPFIGPSSVENRIEFCIRYMKLMRVDPNDRAITLVQVLNLEHELFTLVEVVIEFIPYACKYSMIEGENIMRKDGCL